MHSRCVLRGVPFVFSHIVRVTLVFLWCVTPQKQIQVHIHTLTPHDTKVSIRTL